MAKSLLLFCEEWQFSSRKEPSLRRLDIILSIVGLQKPTVEEKVKAHTSIAFGEKTGQISKRHIMLNVM
jgi:hypothetical protein